MFNLNKYSQTATDVSSILGDAATGLQEGYEAQSVPGTPIPNPISQDTLRDSVATEGQKSLIDRVGGLKAFNYFIEEMKRMYGPSVESMKTQLLTMPQGNNLLDRFTGPGKAGLEQSVEEQGDFAGPAGMVSMSSEVEAAKQEIKRYIERVQFAERTKAEMLAAAFNLKRHKISQIMPQPMEQMQMGQPMPQPMGQEEGQSGRFPVANEGDFIAKFADDLLAFNNSPGTPEYERARIAAEEIRAAVSPGFEEEANSILESVMQLDIAKRDIASTYLIKLYGVLIPPIFKGDQAESQMEPVMSGKKQDAVEGIVRFSLTDSILNNNNDAMTKTAADQFGQQYLLYGPTEKRICPKLRSKNLSVGDVVSEYTCRHHCLDGIAIDDNKTICGEALWRANAMDKYSREYVDEDGNIEGGYINKRFEVNRNVPEENEMRLKPGETRKPRPAAQGNMESRLQDMRSKEGQARDYRPNTNTGDPFEWSHDVDQNNVEVSQKERDRREEASGNQLVQYTNRDQGENNPKKAFNLKQFKTAQKDPYQNVKHPRPGSHDDWNEKATINRMKAKKCPECGDAVCRCNTGDVGDPKSKKLAQTPVAYSPRDSHQTAVNPAAAGLAGPSDIQSIKGQGVDLGKPMIEPSKAMSLEDMETEKYDVAAGQAKIQAMSDEAILWTMKDVNDTIRVQEPMSRKGHSTPKLGYYNDELLTIMDEIRKNRPHLVNQVTKLFSSSSSGFNLKQHKEAKEYNPWAVCNKSTGGKSKGKEKFERCVKHVKEQDLDKDDKEASSKVAETPQPHTTALPDRDYYRQNKPQDNHDPDVKPKKKT